MQRVEGEEGEELDMFESETKDNIRRTQKKLDS
jgi:hypothetical protein